MTALHPIECDPATAPALRLFRPCLGAFERFAREGEELRRALLKLAKIGDPATRKAALKLVGQLQSIEPSVTMIGQVKAGKTSLVNALIGEPGLLPADVNPWTSVVTSLHLAPASKAPKVGARFRFYDDKEWARLIDSGGRIGELAARAGADDELETVRRQVLEMREKSQRRLGRKFEMLLGQEHDYGYVDRDLIERYVCLGDDFGAPEEPASSQGRFADITKSADITLASPVMPARLAIRDTPGVNDTFMMREQITINAIRESRLCVVIFSANQALTSTDLALVRMIANVKSREVLIFVNRIDELADPSRQVPEIRDRILQTIGVEEGAEPPRLIFGSALWANAALQDLVADLPADSVAAMLDWAENGPTRPEEGAGTTEFVWALSGVPELYTTLSARLVDGVGREALQRVARSALNLARGVEAADRVVGEIRRRSGSGPDSVAATARIDGLTAEVLSTLRADLDRLAADYRARLDRAHRAFLDRATASLIDHLERYGEKEVWQYSPDGLRVLLRSNYLMFGKSVQKATATALDAARGGFAGLLASLVDLPPEDCPIAMPEPLRVPPPVSLAQTIALDLQAGWWKSWWFRRRGYKAYADSFHDLIKAETDPMLQELAEVHAVTLTGAAVAQVEAFLDDQRAIVLNVAGKAELNPQAMRAVFGLQAQDDRRALLLSAIKSITRFV